MRPGPRIDIDRLSIALDGIPGVSAESFRDALTRALGRIDLPQDIPNARIASLSLPPIVSRPGDTPDRLAARTADGVAQALRQARP